MKKVRSWYFCPVMLGDPKESRLSLFAVFLVLVLPASSAGGLQPQSTGSTLTIDKEAQ